MQALTEAFLAHLARRRKAAATIERWRPELDRFRTWAAGRPLAAISSDELEFGFLAHWEQEFQARNGREPAANTVRAVMQALASLFAFLDRYDLLVDDQGARLRNPTLRLQPPTIRPAAELDWLRAEHDQTLLACPMNARERTAVMLLRWSGLRVSEAAGLRNCDVDLATESLHVRSSKSDAGYRPVPILPCLRAELDAWRAFTTAAGWYREDGPLLVTRNGTAWSSQYVQQLVARVGERAGLPRRLTPHGLRRTYGSHLLNSGVRVEVVSRLLGHSSTVITERSYARLEQATIRSELLQALTSSASGAVDV